MKSVFICLAVAAQIAVAVSAEALQKIPLYYKRYNSSDFVSAPGQGLQNGMLGGVVQIGNPPQNYTMAFDTSTGFTWVRDAQCNNENCENRNFYNSRDSATVISTGQSFNMDYGDSVVYTTVFLDTFVFSGIHVKNMPFGGAYNMEGIDEGFDGYLGLGRNINLNTTATQYAKRDIPASGFVPNAFQQSSGIQSAQFGMYTTTVGSGFSESGAADVEDTQSDDTVTSGGFGTIKRHYHETPAGYLVIGGVDTDAIKGKLFHIGIKNDTGSGNWAVPVCDAKFVDDLQFDVCKKAKAVFSSSTDVIGLPNKHADEFKKRWYAEYDELDNTFKIPCCLMEKLTSFKIQLGDVHVVIPPQYWSHPREVDSCCEMCRTHIGKSGSNTDYVIGYSLTNAFYSQFDSEKNRVSLAMKKTHIQDGLKLYK